MTPSNGSERRDWRRRKEGEKLEESERRGAVWSGSQSRLTVNLSLHGSSLTVTTRSRCLSLSLFFLALFFYFILFFNILNFFLIFVRMSPLIFDAQPQVDRLNPVTVDYTSSSRLDRQ